MGKVVLCTVESSKKEATQKWRIEQKSRKVSLYMSRLGMAHIISIGASNNNMAVMSENDRSNRRICTRFNVRKMLPNNIRVMLVC